jgi:hypothetical protein
MWIFNRIVMVLVLFGLLVLGVMGVIYSFDLLGYRLADLPGALGLQGIYDGLTGFVGNLEAGNLTAPAIAILALLFLVGLILLIAELKPPSPRLVRLDDGTYATKSAVKEQVLAGADGISQVVSSSARVKARRGKGAKVNLNASVRRGEDLRSARSAIQEQLQQYLGRVGVPVSSMKVDLSEVDPRSSGGKRVN